MNRKFNIDQLLLFFVLSLALLILSFGSSLIIQNERTGFGLPDLSVENTLQFPENGLLHGNEQIRNYNPEATLLYSLDGGKNFEIAHRNLSLRDVKNPDLKLIPTSFHWKCPVGDFPECKSIVVQTQNPGRNKKSESQVLTYFTEEQGNLAVISINTSTDNLFSEKSGLMVFGESSYHDQGFYKNWWNRSANFQQRGMEWEREINMQFFENGKCVHEQNCGMRISGNATRGFPQKSVQLIARRIYGDEQLEYPVFGDLALKKYASLVLRNSGNDNTKTMFADLLMQNLVVSDFIFTQKGRPVVVYLNGNYWGVYDLRERIDPYLLAKYEDVQEDEITILENGGADLKDGSKEEQADFLTLMNLIKTNESHEFRMRLVEEKIDLNSFTDYIIFETFYANGDWPSNNSIWYKAGDKKWKWVLNDLDFGLAYPGSENVNVNNLERLKTQSGVVPDLFNFLISDSKFKDAFKNRASVCMITCFNEARVLEIFGLHQEQYRPHMTNQINRWRMIGSVNEWEKNCKANLDFLLNRVEIYLNQLEKL